MEKGYYKPELEEFCVGLQVETNGCSILPEHQQEWKNHIISPSTIGNFCFDLSCDNQESSVRNNSIRVKLLDREDIEAEGFSESRFGNHVEGTSFIKNNIVVQLIKCLKNQAVVVLNTSFNDKGDVIFSGFLKNKLEFKKLLKQLGI